MSLELEKIRIEIDSTDRQLVELLNRRAELVLKVKEAKAKGKIDVYSPARERQIIERVRELAEGGCFPKAALERIFVSVVSATRSLIGEVKLGCLGPEGSLCFEAAKKQFGEDVLFSFCSDIGELFRLVESGELDFAVIPFDIAGGVNEETLGRFVDVNVCIVAEVLVRSDSSQLLGTDGKTFSRFVVLGAKEPPASGKDRTSLLCAGDNRSGALRELLEAFSQFGVTIDRLESKKISALSPATVFFLEFSRHVSDEQLQLALAELKSRSSYYRLLGSYPQAAHSY